MDAARLPAPARVKGSAHLRLDGDEVRPKAAVDRATPEEGGDRFGRDAGRFAEG
jgi:hypothetical protein